MLSSVLRNWQQENKHHVSGDTVYGVYENIGFSVTEEDGGKLFIFMLSGKDEAFDSLEDLLCNQSGVLRRAQVGDVESYMALFFDDADGRLSGEEMTDVLDYIAGNFRSCGFRTPNVCVKCGAPATKRAFYNDMVQPLCAPCREADKMAKAHSAAAPAAADTSAAYERQSADRTYPERDYPERRQQNPEHTYAPAPAPYDNPRTRQQFDERNDYTDSAPVGEGSTPSGVIGALLGALGGLAAYILSSMLGFEMAALCFTSGIFAVQGYVAFGGLRNKNSGVITSIVVSEILSLAAVLLVTGASNMNDGLDVMFSHLFDLAGLNLLMAAVGALLGVFVSLDTLHKYVLAEDKKDYFGADPAGAGRNRF